MNIDISGVIDTLSVLVKFIRNLSFTFGNYNFTLWEVILVLGTTEGISFILGLRSKSFKNNDSDGD